MEISYAFTEQVDGSRLGNMRVHRIVSNLKQFTAEWERRPVKDDNCTVY